MNTRTPFYVLSAERIGLTGVENAGRSAFLLGRLKDDGINAIPVAGCYKGEKERSVLVPAIQEGKTMTDILDTVKRAARVYEQDTFLHVDSNGFTTLHESDGAVVVSLGRWQQISEDEAQCARGFTQTPDGRYWRAA